MNGTVRNLHAVDMRGSRGVPGPGWEPFTLVLAGVLFILMNGWALAFPFVNAYPSGPTTAA